jgi:adenylate kinase
MNIILIGVQGSGKGTQANLLSRKFGWQHINVGDIFRQHIENNTDLGEAAKNFMDQGLLVPDEYVMNMVKDALDKAKNGFLLDGFPRNVAQCEFLLAHYPISAAIFLNLDDNIARERLMARRLCSVCKKDYNLLFKPPKLEGICDVCHGKIVRREDDNETAIDKRIEKFHKKTEQVIEILKTKGILKIIDANQTVSAIHKEILTILEQ